MGAQLLRNGVAETVECPLGGGVRRAIGERTLAGERGDVHDVATAMREHVGNTARIRQERRTHVGGEDRFEVFEGHLVQWSPILPIPAAFTRMSHPPAASTRDARA